MCSKQLLPCHLREEDLLQNPHFSKLLLSLSQHMDECGLSLILAKEQTQVRALGEGADREEEVGPYLRRFSVFQAWKEVRLHKTKWLRFEILHRVIQELLVDYYVKIQDTNLTSEDKKVRQER